jgi:hypothetical protein
VTAIVETGESVGSADEAGPARVRGAARESAAGPGSGDRMPWSVRAADGLKAFAAAHPDACAVIPLVVLIVLIQAVNIAGFPQITDDEGTNIAQAWAVQHGHGLAPYSYSYDHPPLAWMQLALLSWIPADLPHGGGVVGDARAVMVPVTALGAVLVFLIARHLRMPRGTAVLATAVFGLSPLSVTLQREIYGDNLATVWMLAGFAFALSPRRHLWHHVAAGMCGAVAVLSKETAVILLPGLAVAAWQGSARVTRRFTLVGFGTALVLTLIQFPLFALLKGELLPGAHHNSLMAGLGASLGHAGSGSLLSPDSAARSTLRLWLGRDPVLVLGGSLAVLAACAVPRLRPIGVAGAVPVLMALLPTTYLPAMYVIQVIPFFALAAAGLAGIAARRIAAGRLPARAARIPARTADLVALTGMVAAGWLFPHWQKGDATADSLRLNTPSAQAAAWMRAHVADPAAARVIVDDVLWPDLVDAGFQPGLGAIWFYKADLDPAVTRTLPDGWRDIDYVVSTPIIRADPNPLPTTRQAVAHGTVVASFGTGTSRVDILKVAHP